MVEEMWSKAFSNNSALGVAVRRLGLPSYRPLKVSFRSANERRTTNSRMTSRRKAAFDRWRGQASDGFVYAVKANRYITHLKRLKDAAEPLTRFLSQAQRLGGDGQGSASGHST